MKVSGKIHIPVNLTRGKGQSISTGYKKAELVPEQIWELCKRERAIVSARNRTPVPLLSSPLPSLYTKLNTPAPISVI
jgi:hypothetical protein